jgi:adenine/guanine phosphoribosyltransferase-like PRPP-binding protein
MDSGIQIAGAAGGFVIAHYASMQMNPWVVVRCNGSYSTNTSIATGISGNAW